MPSGERAVASAGIFCTTKLKAVIGIELEVGELLPECSYVHTPYAGAVFHADFERSTFSAAKRSEGVYGQLRGKK